MYLRVSFVRLMRKIAGYLTKLKKILLNKIKTAS